MNELYHYGVKGMKWGVRKDQLTSAKVAVDSASKLTDLAKKRNTKHAKNKADKAFKKMNLDNMSNAELQQYINRYNLEKQYKQIYYDKNKTRGSERVTKVLDVAGDVLVGTSSALTIALALKRLI